MKRATILALALITGCASSPRRPYSPAERRMMAHAITGQSFDSVTTSMAMTDPRASEQNPIWWNPKDSGSMLAGKFVLMGAGYLVGEWKPKWRYNIWAMFAGSGYFAGTWNTYQMIRHDVNPWRKW